MPHRGDGAEALDTAEGALDGGSDFVSHRIESISVHGVDLIRDYRGRATIGRHPALSVAIVGSVGEQVLLGRLEMIRSLAATMSEV